jgi:tryptophan 2,3-dioxygenase
MQKAKLLKDYQGETSPLKIEELSHIQKEQEDIDEILFFKHKCDEAWIKELLKRAKIKKSKIKIDEVRRLLIEAVKMKMEK